MQNAQPPDASCTCSPNCDIQNCLQTLPNASYGQNHSWLRTTELDHSCPQLIPFQSLPITLRIKSKSSHGQQSPQDLPCPLLQPHFLPSPRCSGPHHGDYPWSFEHNRLMPASEPLHLLFPLSVVPRSLYCSHLNSYVISSGKCSLTTQSEQPLSGITQPQHFEA